MRIEQDTLNEIRNSVDIVDVISSYLPLTARGKNYFGVCPFHEDHSPSMSVSREKQIYTCFSCGSTGNVFKFISDYENIPFIEAVKKCADIGGIPLNIDINKTSQIKPKLQVLYDIYQTSQMFYQNNMSSTVAHEARNYLKKRDIDDDIIKEFGIGLAVNESDMLTKLLQSKKFSDKDLIRSGLVSDSSINLTDIYRNRIMFPLYDINGKVIGYNGRAYHGEDTNKYINSKETELFKKRNYLYNYHRARSEARLKKEIILMEGPMDVIRAYTIGIKNVVATLGTAFGHEQALLVRRLASNVILCFDGDQAGLKATKLAIEELDKVGIIPQIVRLNDNMDPDEYIRTNGKESFLDVIAHPMNLVEFKELNLKLGRDLSNSSDMADYVNDMIQEIGHIDDEILKEVSLQKLSQESHLDVSLLRKKVTELKPTIVIMDMPKKDRSKITKYEASERNLVYYMLRSGNVIKMYDNNIISMMCDKYRRLAMQISAFYKKNGYIKVADLLTAIYNDKEAVNTIGELESLSLREQYDYDEIEDYIENIKQHNELIKVNNYKKQLKQETDFNKKIELANKIVEYKLRSEDNDR